VYLSCTLRFEFRLNVIALETSVAAANGDVGAMAFLTNSAQRAKLREIASMTSGVIPLWDEERILGRRIDGLDGIRSALRRLA